MARDIKLFDLAGMQEVVGGCRCLPHWRVQHSATVTDRIEGARLHGRQDQDKERQALWHTGRQNALSLVLLHLDESKHAKACTEKVQLKQAEAAENGSSDGRKELQRHRQTLQTVTDERNRLANRLESTLNVLEKEKAYHEQSVERVTSANSKLMEEKDRIAREVERLSNLYTESVNQLQAGQETHGNVFRSDSEANSVDPVFQPCETQSWPT
ncbi:unnamed protein product [Cladocopium goreaui]|uniref:Centrosomal protein of 162 kDa n=1 Tax=Cladocopium goreaui TaxID=2562237 RepID=A0A9P1G276_9DINO|nr:unnamed protein product [Cladocopium goreaui]